MSRFGGPSAGAAIGVQENLHGSILSLTRGNGLTRPSLATVLVNGGGAKISGVIFGRALDRDEAVTLIGASVIVTKAGGRWMII